MSFLDQKEQVYTLSLTKYGREQISKGLFKPSYYAFFDDDILYDISKASSTEGQNESEDRIVSSTPKNSFLFNVDKLSISNPKKITYDKDSYTEIDLYQNTFSLSNSEIGEQKSPKFTFFSLQNNLSSSESYKSITVSEAGGVEQKKNYFIPQLNFDLNVFFIIEKLPQELVNFVNAIGGAENLEGFSLEQFGIDENTRLLKVFDGGIGVKMKLGRTIGLLAEENGTEQKTGYDIDFHLIKKDKQYTSANGQPATEKGFVQDLQHVDTTLLEVASKANLVAPMLYSLVDFQTGKDIQYSFDTGFGPAEGLYDNIPQVEEDFC